jgi:UDP-N-acetylmuramoyl-L-alanyl-D-glutamate--2,6-diaminopimelate ligase
MHITMPSIWPVTAHTQHVGAGSIFVAINGFNQNGEQYISEALARSASTIVVADTAKLAVNTIENIADHRATLIKVPNTRLALATLSAQAAGYPAQKLEIIGITGTKGKTTTVFLLEHILRCAGISTARITGVNNSINGNVIPSSLTTPQPDYLHQFFKVCVEHGVTHVVMEVAAQALSLDRVATVQFSHTVFTNFAREHLEFYKNMDEYCTAKLHIFKQAKDGGLHLINGDDPFCTRATYTVPCVQTFGFLPSSTIQAHEVHVEHGVSIAIDNHIFYCPGLIGHFNAQNMLAACLVARACAVSPQCINKALATFSPVPGRMEPYAMPNGATCIIDYAHNPSSYEALLSTLRPRTDCLIVLFGASGTRDAGKRPYMGAIAAQYADHIILTSDNPGMVDAFSIINDIIAGIPVEHRYKVIIETDREQAICRGYSLTCPNALLVLLGKGTDEYQVIQGARHYFSERNIILKLQNSQFLIDK